MVGWDEEKGDGVIDRGRYWETEVAPRRVKNAVWREVSDFVQSGRW